MRKKIIAIVSLLISTTALSFTGNAVQRDMCGARVLTPMTSENYRVDCLNLGEISINSLLKDYRVTATIVTQGDDRYEAGIVLFVEKAEKAGK